MKLFGIKTIKINGCHINTFSVSIKQNAVNTALAKYSGLGYIDNSGRKGDKIEFNYTSIDVVQFNAKVQKLGELLKKVAQANLDAKYRWVK